MRTQSCSGEAGAEAEDAPARLPWLALILWALLAVAVPLLSQALNLIDVLAFPLGYFMLAQGALLSFVAVGFCSARRQDRRKARSTTDR